MKDLLEGKCITVFTDGSSYIDTKNNFYEASSAVVISINNDIVYKFGCYHNNGTNSIGEVYAMMLAIEKVEELKRDNPELRDYFTVYISDSKYVVSSLNEWIHSWAVLNKYNEVWKSSSNKPIAYQWIMKYLYDKYISKHSWQENNLIIHINGHIQSKDIGKYYSKALKRNSKQTWKYQRAITRHTFESLVQGNIIVDRFAEKIRLEKLFYYEERNENTPWVKRKRRIPVRNQRLIIKSRKNESRI